MNFVHIGSTAHACARGKGKWLLNFKTGCTGNSVVFCSGENSSSATLLGAARAYGCLDCDNDVFIDSIALGTMRVYRDGKHSDLMHLSKPFFERSVYGRILRCHFKA